MTTIKVGLASTDYGCFIRRSTQAGSITQGTVYHLVRKLYLEEIAAVETRHDIPSAARDLSVY
jgi:hypothetical protein